MTSTQEEPRVFISYRREDTSAHAGRLYDAMVARFGERNVFMDIDLPPGVDFVERITRVVSGCAVLIVVMGRDWATVEDGDGSRLADPNDFVRLELETALSNPHVTVIPALVSGARMPEAEDLPPQLQPLARRNALELSDARWSYDVGRLTSVLEELLPDATRHDGTAPPTPPAIATSPARLVLEAIAVAAVAAYLGRWLGEQVQVRGDEVDAIVRTVLRRGATWGLAGAALAAWLALRTRRADLAGAVAKGLVLGALGGAIGGVVWATPVHLDGGSLLEDTPKAALWIEVAALAITGGFVGALLGSLWRPSRRGAGLLGGALGGALIQLMVIVADADKNPEPAPGETAFGFGLATAAMAGMALVFLLRPGRQAARSGNSAGGGT